MEMRSNKDYGKISKIDSTKSDSEESSHWSCGREADATHCLIKKSTMVLLSISPGINLQKSSWVTLTASIDVKINNSINIH